MKKTLALLLCLAMLFTALTVNVFADATPSVKVITHKTSVADETATNFVISLANFDSLKGYDLVIEGDAGVHIKSATALNAKTPLKEGVNYTITDNKLHIVELTSKATGDIITVKAVVDADGASHKITVTACDLAKSKDALYATSEYSFDATADIVPFVEIVETTTQDTTVAQPEASTKTFIPYGSVYTVKDGKIVYAEKDENGTFTDTTGATVKAFKLPDSGFGTFGVSDSAVKTAPAKQFGNVAKGYAPAAKDYGTLVIVGNWTSFKDWYLSNKAFSDAEIIAKLYNGYKTANAENKYDFVWFEAGNGAKIKVYDVAQYNYMWKSADTLEYAVRVYGLKDGIEYAAAAYNVNKDGTNPVFSEEIKVDVYQNEK